MKSANDDLHERINTLEVQLRILRAQHETVDDREHVVVQYDAARRRWSMLRNKLSELARAAPPSNRLSMQHFVFLLQTRPKLQFLMSLAREVRGAF